MEDKLEVLREFNSQMWDCVELAPNCERDYYDLALELVSDGDAWVLQFGGGQHIGWSLEFNDEDISFREYVYQCWNEFKRIVNKIELRKEN